MRLEKIKNTIAAGSVLLGSCAAAPPITSTEKTHLNSKTNQKSQSIEDYWKQFYTEQITKCHEKIDAVMNSRVQKEDDLCKATGIDVETCKKVDPLEIIDECLVKDNTYGKTKICVKNAAADQKTNPPVQKVDTSLKDKMDLSIEPEEFKVKPVYEKINQCNAVLKKHELNTSSIDFFTITIGLEQELLKIDQEIDRIINSNSENTITEITVENLIKLLDEDDNKKIFLLQDKKRDLIRKLVLMRNILFAKRH